jgi:exosortase
MTASWRHILFGAWWLTVTVVQAGTLRALIDHSRQDMSASHLVLIPLVSAALMIRSRNDIFSSLRWSPIGAAGLGLLGAGVWLSAVASHASGDAANWLTPAVALLVILWVAGFLLCYGGRAARAALFPLLFLGFTIPIPALILDPAVALLKSGSTEVVAGLFTLSGTPFHREGFVFSLPSVVIEVADECSGIRSSIALLLTSLLAGHLFLEKRWTKTLLVFVVLPITMLKNGVRIVGLSLLAVHVDPGFLTGQLHHEGGIVFFAIALAMLAPLFGVLRTLEGSGRTIEPEASPART